MNKFTHWFRHAWLVLLIASIWIVLDQITKNWIRATIPLYSKSAPFPDWADYFSFEHVKNYGAAFGILQNQGMLFVVIAGVVTIAILLYVRYLPLEQRFVRFLLGLQLGGAVGNLIDRLHQGYVTDFIKTGIPGIYYIPNYNIADSGIVVGVTGLALYILWSDLRSQRQAAAAATTETVET
jgi:signal peptidase II